MYESFISGMRKVFDDQEVNKKTVIDNVTDGLSEAQKDKLVELYENIEVDSNDENFDKFRASAVLIRENYFPKEVSTVEDSDTLIDDAPVDKETITEDRPTNTAVDNYVKTLNRYVK